MQKKRLPDLSKRLIAGAKHPRRAIGHINKNTKSSGPMFYFDSPTRNKFTTKEVLVSGWYIPTPGKKVTAIRIKNNNKSYAMGYGNARQDVAGAFPGVDAALHSGFAKRIKFEDGTLAVEVDEGEGYKKILEVPISYAQELDTDVLYNPDLAENFAEHQTLLQNRKQYFYETEVAEKFERAENDPRLVALYLPQFHPIAENDKFWGKGFTEWRNVSTAVPRFIGHEQPLPQDLGYYDLRLESVIKEQIDLAKRYGIYGFCFYYYWFSGKRLLEKPLDSFLRHKDWDFNFSICWANENWTKRWDGRNNDIIIAQKYDEDDPLKFIQDVEDILLDPRYIREEGKPVLTVYRIESLDDPKRYAKVWREYFRKKHKLELQLVAVMSFSKEDPRKFGFDAAMDFLPSTNFFKKTAFTNNKFPFMYVNTKLLDINYQGSVGDYRKIALSEKIYPFFDFPTYKSVMPSWDNDARRKGKGMTYANTSPDLYAHWLTKVLDFETKKRPDPLVFINAWNEWAEGTVLEPTLQQGHAILNRTAETLAKYSHNKSNQEKWTPYKLLAPKNKSQLAVVMHIDNKGSWPVLENKLEVLDKVPHNLFVTITKKDEHVIGEIKANYPTATIIVVPNRGRDMLPFVFVARRLSELGYKYILKLRAEKSDNEALDNLLPNSEEAVQTLNKLQSDAAIVGPAKKYVILPQPSELPDSRINEILANIYGQKKADQILSSKQLGFFASSTFWCNLDDIKLLLDQNFLPEDFESEKGQANGTLAHALQILMTAVAADSKNKNIYFASSNGIEIIKS